VDVAGIVEVMNAQVPRAVLLYDGLLSVLQKYLGPTLAALPEFSERHQPKGFYYAGETLEPKGWPVILVGGSITTTEWGVGHADKHAVQVTVAYHVELSRREFQDALDIAQVVRGILWHPEVRGPVANEDGQIIWTSLYPTGLAPVPQGYPHYSGWIARFDATQPPGSTLWPTS